MSFTGALLFAAIVLGFAGILAYAVAVHERRKRIARENAALKQDQQTPQRTAILRDWQPTAHRRNHGAKGDPWALDSQDPPRGRAS